MTYSYSQCGFDELAIWSRVLSDSEISTLYNSGSGLRPGCLFFTTSDWVITNTQTCDNMTRTTSGKIMVQTGGLLEIKGNSTITANDLWIEKSGEAVHVYSGKLQVN